MGQARPNLRDPKLIRKTLIKLAAGRSLNAGRNAKGRCKVTRRIYKPPVRLTEEQRIRYHELKEAIRKDIKIGTEAFTRTGEHLLIIRKEKLYREEFDTFEAFCREVFGHSKTYANNLIIAFDVIRGLLGQGVVVLPDNEHIARQLAKYPKRDRKMIWQRALQIAERGKLGEP